jgi:dipeptidyl aminopeptidase/acylaminoacyl peptidase
MRAYAFVLLTACTAAPPPAENEMQAAAITPMESETQPPEHHLVPTWRTGDTWTVRLRRSVPIMPISNPFPPFDDQEWTYKVVDRTPDVVHISARRDISPGPASIWRFTFAPNGRILSAANPWGEEPFVADADAPILDPDQELGQEVADAWPRFPLEEAFGPDDAELRQRSRPAGNELEVAIVRAGYDRWFDHDFVRTATQRWEPGRPWWSVLRIEEEYTSHKGTVTYLTIEGEVIAWPTNTP